MSCWKTYVRNLLMCVCERKLAKHFSPLLSGLKISGVLKFNSDIHLYSDELPQPINLFMLWRCHEAASLSFPWHFAGLLLQKRPNVPINDRPHSARQMTLGKTRCRNKIITQITLEVQGVEQMFLGVSVRLKAGANTPCHSSWHADKCGAMTL